MTHAAGGSLSNAPWNNISSITYRQKHRFHGADVINFLRHFQKRLTPDEEKIDQFLAVITPRKVDAGHCIRFQNKYYELKDEQGMRSDFHKGTSVMVIRTLSGKLYASVCERIYCMDEVPSHEQSSRYFGSDQSTKAEKKKRYIPDMNHPWKKDNFMKYVHAMYGREEHWAC